MDSNLQQTKTIATMKRKGFKKVMIMEDMLSISSYLESLVEKLGFEVVATTQTGEDAMDLYLYHQPEVIFADIQLKGKMTGIDAIRQIKTQGNPMVIYITDTTKKDIVSEAKETRPDAYLKKPFDEAQFKVTTELALHSFQQYNEKITKLESTNNLQFQNIQELSETNAHLVAATWRERELKKQLADSLEELQKTKSIIELQNKRISDSINYAKRLQQAIIPNSKLISSVLEEHFMIYRPKDVVSGDFPWLMVKNDYVYIGAVDCTGHGVPGAMLSMIGYLMLDSIVGAEGQCKMPSEILLELHQGIVKTLKQDVEGNNASDGMDIGLCRINTKTREVVYSGAHRPLLIYSEGEIDQIKGDRFPIGGVQYKGKNYFTDSLINLKEGDSIYVFSDGLPDQFGGESKRKYGTKRIKQMILDNQGIPMEDINTKFENDINTWMEGERQLDDMLLIGMRM